jgi:Ser/Thr protein kinase RdoA (MazF antagonist)
MDPVARVLAAYPRVLHWATRVPLGNHGGFSGARLWRLDSPAGAFCLRAGAVTENRDHLLHRHGLIARARAAGLAFVPAVLPAANGSTVVEAAGRCWEMMDWMPGRADFHASPGPTRLHAAVSALAKLHLAWQPTTPMVAAVPAVGRRLEALGSMTPAALTLPHHPLLGPLAKRSRRCLARWLPEMSRVLHRWQGFTAELQPCLRDVWHDHLLFEGDTLTGIVDYAGAGIDSVATDLARMLGSLIGDQEDRWSEALKSYRTHRPLSSAEEQLAQLLDRTGVIAGVCHWVRWFGKEENGSAETAAAVRRLEGLLQRIEAW